MAVEAWWNPAEPERPRAVQVLAIVRRSGQAEEALIIETGKPLNGVAQVPLTELKRVR